MTTAEALEAMTDRGKFELLATSVLRKSNKNYEAVLHLGINASGETVQAPVDGFCLIPGSNPPHFVMIQHTTTDRSGLEKKWLFDYKNASSTTKASASDNGDLIKAGNLTSELRKNFPDGQFTLVLSTNQHLSGDLPAKVYTQAAQFNIACDIWEQSRFADFLDTEAEGHWIRKKYLGIDAELLSESLLHNICEQSIASYEKNLLLIHPNGWISRHSDTQIADDIQSSKYTVEALIGESGFGKSTAAYQALHKHLSASGLGLWIPPSLLEDSLSLDGLIDRALHAFCPSLLIDSGKVALRIAAGAQFVIAVDDINRTDFPSQLLRRILTWSRPEQTNTAEQGRPIPPVLVLCPVWPQVWAAVNLEFKKASWINTVYLGPMSLTEGSAAVKSAVRAIGLDLLQTEAETLSKKLANDPILIGLFGLLLTQENRDELSLLTENTVEKFIETCTREASSLSDRHYLSADFEKVLAGLALQMLQRRKLYPSWEDIRTWFQNEPEYIPILRELVRLEKLCRVSDDAGKATFVFRHDRIQETLLTQAAKAAFLESAKAADLLSEPYYAEIFGRALARSDLNKEFLQEVQRQNPVALIEAIRNFGTASSGFHHLIVEAAKGWVNNEVASQKTSEAILDAASWILVETDSPAVLEITELFPPNLIIFLARLRNGSASSGARYCTRRNGLEPAVNDRLRDRIIDVAKRNHGQQIIDELKNLLTSADAMDNKRRGFLALAGYMATEELEDAIASCWELATEKAIVLLEAIWAAIHCCGTQPAKLLDPLIATWINLPEKDDRPGYPGLIEIAEELRFALARGIPEKVVDYFVGVYDKHESLCWPIIYMLDHVDAPDAVNLIVRYAADIGRKIEGTQSFSPQLVMLGDAWDSSQNESRKLSQDSLMRLLELWTNEKNDKFVQRSAFYIWLRATRQENLERLRSINSQSPHYRDVLIKRMRLGDRDVVPDLLAALPFDGYWKSSWLHFAPSVWCADLFDVVDNQLGSLKEITPTDYSGGWKDSHFHLSELLMQIPIPEAESLLIKHWGHLQYSPLFAQTALFVGTPKCLALAAESIVKYPAGIQVFKHVASHFGFMNIERSRFLTKRHLDSLIPYLSQFDEGDLWELAETCQRLGIPEWTKQHLSGNLTEQWRKRYLPTEDDLFQDLNELSTEEYGTARTYFWLEDAEKRHDSKKQILEVVDRWLGSHPTFDNLKIAAACIQSIGSRPDLALLDKYIINGPQDKIVEVKMSTRYFVCRRSLD